MHSLYYVSYAFAGLVSQLPCFWTETLSGLQKLPTIYLHLDLKHKVCIHFKMDLLRWTLPFNNNVLKMLSCSFKEQFKTTS